MCKQVKMQRKNKINHFWGVKYFQMVSMACGFICDVLIDEYFGSKLNLVVVAWIRMNGIIAGSLGRRISRDYWWWPLGSLWGPGGTLPGKKKIYFLL